MDGANVPSSCALRRVLLPRTREQISGGQKRACMHATSWRHVMHASGRSRACDLQLEAPSCALVVHVREDVHLIYGGNYGCGLRAAHPGARAMLEYICCHLLEGDALFSSGLCIVVDE